MKNFFFTFSLLLLISVNIAFADWEPLSGLPQGQITGLLTFNKKVYAIVWGTGIFVSSDYGDNWVQQNEGVATPFVKCIAKVGTTLLVGATDTSGVFRSTDNGYNWVRSVDSLTERSIATFSVDGNIVYLLTESSVIFKSTDLGVTWMQVRTSDLDNYTITSIAASNGRILVGTSSGDLFLSTDDGNNWTNIKNQQIYSTITTLLWDGDNIYCGTQAGIYFSSNFGTNWFQRNLGLKVQDISLIEKVNNAFVVGTRTGGVYFSVDEGKTWFEFNEGISDLSILSVAYDQYYIYVGTEYGAVARRNINEIKLPEVAPPVLTYPPNGAKGVDKLVNFAWETSKGAIGYHLIVAKDASFSPSSIVVDKSDIKTTFFPSVSLQPNRKYFWKVAAIDYQSNEKWSEVYSFETIFEPVKPILYYPFDNFQITKLPIQFYWSDVGDVEHYRFVLSTSKDFQNPIVDVTTKDTIYSISQGIESNMTYYWFVAAKYNDTTLVSSDTLSFSTTTLGVEIEIKNEVVWKLFDNKLFFEFKDLNEEKMVTIEVFNNIGQSVLFGWFETKGLKNTAEIDLSKLPTGTYYFVLKVGNNRFISPLLWLK